MNDFTSPVWSWVIAIGTVVSIAGTVWLIAAFRGGRRVVPGSDKATTGHVWDGDLAELNNPLPGWWLGLFILTIVFGIVYLALYPGLGAFGGLLGTDQIKAYEREVKQAEQRYGPLFAQFQARPIEALAGDPKAREIGRRLFVTYCAQCHGSDARGARGYPNLTDGDWIWGGTPEAIVATITRGRQAAMPPWGELLTEQQIADVAEYVVSLSREEVNPQAVARGEKVFQQNCAVCHGPDAKGNPMLGAPNLTDDVWLYGGSKKRIIETIAGGRSGHMPAHEGFLDAGKIHVLAAYVWSLSHHEQRAAGEP